MIEVILFVATLAVSLYYWWTKSSHFWKYQNIPYLQPTFPFGNISNMVFMKKTAGEIYRDYYRQFAGHPAGGIFKFNQPMLLLRDPELVRTVMVKEFHSFEHNDFQISMNVDPLLAYNPFVSRGEKWKIRRSVQLPSLSLAKVRNMIPEFVICAEQMVEFLSENLDGNHEQPLPEDLEGNSRVCPIVSTRLMFFPRDRACKVMISRGHKILALLKSREHNNEVVTREDISPGDSLLRKNNCNNSVTVREDDVQPFSNFFSLDGSFFNDCQFIYDAAKEISSHYTADSVAYTAFGLNSNSFSKGEGAFATVFKCEMFGSTFWDNLAVICAICAPTIGTLFRLRILRKDAEEYFVKAIKETFEHRKKNDIRRCDLLQHLIDSTDEKTVNIMEIAGHCMTFFLQGYETSAILLGFTLYELAANPDVQESLRNEILAVSDNIKAFDATKIEGLELLDNVISETLRLHPPIQSLSRICTKNSSICANGKKIQVREGMSVVVPILALQTDPENFPNPEEFRPERFSKESKSLIKKFTYMPFGEGPRACVGIKYVKLAIKVAVIAILLKFKIENQDKVTGPVKLNPLSVFLHTAKDGLWINFKKL